MSIEKQTAIEAKEALIAKYIGVWSKPSFYVEEIQQLDKIIADNT